MQVTTAPIRERHRAHVGGDKVEARGRGCQRAGGDAHGGILLRYSNDFCNSRISFITLNP
jgi:hypothetical protein